MLMNTRIMLAVAIVLSTAFTAAAAATKHRRVSHVGPGLYNVVPGNLVHNGVSLSTACLPTDSPCRTQPDGW
jgi:hypothetical protein